jgi:DNA-binding transcriptional MerR regulator
MHYLAPNSNQQYKIYSALAFARFRVISILKSAPFYVASVELLTDELSPQREQELHSLVVQLKRATATYFEMIRLNESARQVVQLDLEKSLNKLIYNIAA